VTHQSETMVKPEDSVPSETCTLNQTTGDSYTWSLSILLRSVRYAHDKRQ